MLKKLSDIELSKVSGSTGGICHACQKKLSNNEKVLCMYPVYNVYDATTKDFIETLEAGRLTVCLNPDCRNWFEIFRRYGFLANNTLYIPEPDQEKPFFSVYEE